MFKFFLPLLFVFTNCFATAEYVKIAGRITDRCIKELAKEEKMRYMGGGGAMIDNITEVSMMFSVCRKVSVEEARMLCVKSVEKIRNALNSEPRLKPFLNPYPFPASSIDISIIFENPNGSYVSYGCVYLGTGGVSSIHQNDGSVRYSSYNVKTEMLERYYQESYETALSLVQKNAGQVGQGGQTGRSGQLDEGNRCCGKTGR